MGSTRRGEDAKTQRGEEGEAGFLSARAVVAIHGILSKATPDSWTADLAEHLRREGVRRDEHISTFRSTYRELPLPRLAALRNPGRARRLLERVDLYRSYAPEQTVGLVEDYVAHSNGGMIALHCLRRRMAQGRKCGSLVLIAPALRAGKASRVVGELVRSGTIKRAVLVRCMHDRTLSWVSRRKLVTWPWGSLGVDGWYLDELGEVPAGSVTTRDLPAGHSEPLRLGNRQETFETIVGPALFGGAAGKPDLLYY